MVSSNDEFTTDRHVITYFLSVLTSLANEFSCLILLKNDGCGCLTLPNGIKDGIYWMVHSGQHVTSIAVPLFQLCKTDMRAKTTKTGVGMNYCKGLISSSSRGQPPVDTLHNMASPDLSPPYIVRSTVVQAYTQQTYCGSSRPMNVKMYCRKRPDAAMSSEDRIGYPSSIA